MSDNTLSDIHEQQTKIRERKRLVKKLEAIELKLQSYKSFHNQDNEDDEDKSAYWKDMIDTLQKKYTTKVNINEENKIQKMEIVENEIKAKENKKETLINKRDLLIKEFNEKINAVDREIECLETEKQVICDKFETKKLGILEEKENKLEYTYTQLKKHQDNSNRQKTRTELHLELERDELRKKIDKMDGIVRLTTPIEKPKPIEVKQEVVKKSEVIPVITTFSETLSDATPATLKREMKELDDEFTKAKEGTEEYEKALQKFNKDIESMEAELERLEKKADTIENAEGMGHNWIMAKRECHSLLDKMNNLVEPKRKDYYPFL